MRTDQATGPYAWLDESAVRTASDIILAVVLLSLAAAVFVGAGDLPFGRLDETGPAFYPAVVAGLLALVRLLLLARGVLVGTAPPIRWNPIALATVAAATAGAPFAAERWGGLLLLSFGAAEYAAFMTLVGGC